MATREQVKELELLDALFSLDSDPVYEVPEESREVGVHPLDTLLELLKFANDLSFKMPECHQKMFPLIRLADFVGLDRFLDAAAGWLIVGREELCNYNCIRKVYSLARGRYRVARKRYENLKDDTVCGVCKESITGFTLPITFTQSACCGLLYHSHCKLKSPECPKCKKALNLLPCLYYNRPIEGTGDYFSDYTKSISNRTPFCGADIHEECRTATSSWSRCSLCSCPLTWRWNGWSTDKEMVSAMDIIFRRREARINDMRRRANIMDYKITPGYQPFALGNV